MHKSRSGFTIVELLIVIVVIAILATISVVAYSGIRDRADAAAVASDLKAAKKHFYSIKPQVGQQHGGMKPTILCCTEGAQECLQSSLIMRDLEIIYRTHLHNKV